MKVIELHASVTESNEKDADQIRTELKEKGTLLINLMSSPGSGKTTLLSRVIGDLQGQLSMAVVEADIASDVDAVRIERLGAASIQAHTDGMCHMDAGMTKKALDSMGYEGADLVFLENVGNLICPAEFDTGAGLNIMILSIPEGDDKPLKYPLMFQQSDALVITKMDTREYFDFDLEKCISHVTRENPNIEIFPLSAKTGAGMDVFEGYLMDQLSAWKGQGSADIFLP